MSQILRSRLWWLVLGISMVGQAFGQGGATGAITGTVEDASGAVVANADVKITNQDTGTVTRATKTDATGSFTVNLLPVAIYTVMITSGGFREAKIPDVVVRVTETTRMTAKLVPLRGRQRSVGWLSKRVASLPPTGPPELKGTPVQIVGA